MNVFMTNPNLASLFNILCHLLVLIDVPNRVEFSKHIVLFLCMVCSPSLEWNVLPTQYICHLQNQLIRSSCVLTSRSLP